MSEMRDRITTAGLFCGLIGGCVASFIAPLSLAVGVGGLVLSACGLLVAAIAWVWPR